MMKRLVKPCITKKLSFHRNTVYTNTGLGLFMGKYYRDENEELVEVSKRNL